jgi:hypothetical protein
MAKAKPMAQVELGRFHLRVARPSDNLDAVVKFYRDGLGFTILYEFADHDSFDGVMLLRNRSPSPAFALVGSWLILVGKGAAS